MSGKAHSEDPPRPAAGLTRPPPEPVRLQPQPAPLWPTPMFPDEREIGAKSAPPARPGACPRIRRCCRGSYAKLFPALDVNGATWPLTPLGGVSWQRTSTRKAPQADSPPNAVRRTSSVQMKTVAPTVRVVAADAVTRDAQSVEQSARPAESDPWLGLNCGN